VLILKKHGLRSWLLWLQDEMFSGPLASRHGSITGSEVRESTPAFSTWGNPKADNEVLAGIAGGYLCVGIEMYISR
jgi:hypothetical protein